MKRPTETGIKLLQEALSAVTAEDCAAYAVGTMLGLEQMPEKQRREFIGAVLAFAAVGWAFFHGVDELGERRRRTPKKKVRKK
jgi:hypothetical protein